MSNPPAGGLVGKLVVAFQPHLYSRTKLLKNDFAEALSLSDEIVLAPIYAAREPNDPEISSEVLADLIKTKNSKVLSFPNNDQVADYLLKNNQAGDSIIIMGAGDLSQITNSLVEKKA